MMVEETQAMADELMRLATQQDDLMVERDRLGQELARLAEAVAAGGELPALLSAMRTKQGRVADINGLLEHLDGIGPDAQAKLAAFQVALTALAQESVKGLPALLRARDSGRQALATLLPNPITVTPDIDQGGRVTGWTFRGEAWLGKLLDGRIKAERNGKAGYTYSQFLWACRG